MILRDGLAVSMEEALKQEKTWLNLLMQWLAYEATGETSGFFCDFFVGNNFDSSAFRVANARLGTPDPR